MSKSSIPAKVYMLPYDAYYYSVRGKDTGVKAIDMFGSRIGDLPLREQLIVAANCWAEQHYGKGTKFEMTNRQGHNISGYVHKPDGSVSDLVTLRIDIVHRGRTTPYLGKNPKK